MCVIAFVETLAFKDHLQFYKPLSAWYMLGSGTGLLNIKGMLSFS